MPRTIKADGRTITVPDDATPEEINQIVGPAPSTPSAETPPAKKSMIDALTEIRPHQSDTPVHAVEDVLGNIGAGGLSVLLKPVETAKGIASAVRHPFKTADEMATQLGEHPYETIEAAIGQAGATAGLTEAAGKVAGVLPKVARRSTEVVSKTGPRETANLVKETQAANEAEVAKTAEKNAKQEADRKVDLKKHFDKTQAAKEANVQAEAPVARKAALNRGVEQLDTKFQDDLSALRKSVNEKANAKYSALNAVLDAEEANPEFLPTALQNAMDQIKGSETEPTILKDMAKKTQHGDVLTYRDLQGYYSEIGRELQKGTLPGDVYHAYDVLQEAIGNEMQNVANAKGMGPQLADARATWRQMKQTFYDPKSPLTKALKAGERGKSIAALSGADQTGIEALAKYDPDLARRANVIRGYQAEAKSIPSKPGKLKSLPKLEPKPEPVRPNVSKVGPEEVQSNKEANLRERAEGIRNKGGGWANTFVILDAIRNAIHGNIAGIGQDIAVRGIFGAGKAGIANLLERPEVVRLLTKPTAEDIAAIPPEMRGDFGTLAQEATKKGIRVDPRLYAVAGAEPKKRVAAALSQ